MDSSDVSWMDRATRLGRYFEGRPWRCPGLEKGLSVGVACSGGADSLALLLLVWLRCPELRGQLCVLHMNHGLRGVESAGDAAFVAEVAAALSLPFREGQGNAAGAGEGVSEAVLREERLGFFRRSGVGVVLQGHQQDDVLETMLMRLCRGSGVEGLAAPVPSRTLPGGLTLLRPLLEWGREEIREGLRACAIPWREDGSNQGSAYFRNRVRQQVVPAMVKASSGHDALRGAARARRLLEEDAVALAAWADAVVAGLPPAGEPWALPPGLPRALLRRVLRYWLNGVGAVTLTAAAVDTLLDAWEQGQALALSAGQGLTVCVEAGVLLRKSSVVGDVESQGDAVLLPGTSVHLPGGGVLSAKRIRLDAHLRARVRAGEVDSAREACLGWDFAGQPVAMRVRFRKPGDRYQALGAPGGRKIKEILIDAKVPLMERERLPLVCHGQSYDPSQPASTSRPGAEGQAETLLWIPGFPPAEVCRVKPDTKWALWLTWSARVEIIKI